MTSYSSDKLQGPSPFRKGSEYFLFCRFFWRILPLKCWPRSSVKFYIRANDSQFISTDLAVFVHLSRFEETARRPIQVKNYRGRVPLEKEANIFCFAVSFVEYCSWNAGLEAQWNFVYGHLNPVTSTDLAVLVHLSHFEETARRPIQVTNYRGRVPLGKEANIFCFAVSFVRCCRWNVGLEAQRNFIYGQTTASSNWLIWRSSSTWVTLKKRQDVRFKWQITGAESL